MPIIWVSFVSNVATDMYLLFIPIPMLWGSSLKLVKKLATTMLLSAGLLIIICATLKSIYVIVVSSLDAISSKIRADSRPGPSAWRPASGRVGNQRNIHCGCHDQSTYDLPSLQVVAIPITLEHVPIHQQQQSIQTIRRRFRVNRWRWRVKSQQGRLAQSSYGEYDS